MDRNPIFIGLDSRQDLVQLCVVDEDGRLLCNRGWANTWQTIKAQAERVGIVKRAAIASCSGAADLADEWVH